MASLNNAYADTLVCCTDLPLSPHPPIQSGLGLWIPVCYPNNALRKGQRRDG